MTTTGIPQQLDLARLLTLVERRVTSRLAGALKTDGATIDEWRVLSLLGDGSGHAMNEIAEFAMLPAPTLTKIVDRLVSAGLVYRRVDEGDRRRVLVFRSDRGGEALLGWNAAVQRERESLDAAVGTEESALLSTLLARVADQLLRN
jgi:DNA-binding MarR family transcriptional regulator